MTDQTASPDRRPCVLVTGAAARIGACTAETLHERGCNVLLHCNSSVEKAATLAARLNDIRPGSAGVAQAADRKVVIENFTANYALTVSSVETSAITFGGSVVTSELTSANAAGLVRSVTK